MQFCQQHICACNKYQWWRNAYIRDFSIIRFHIFSAILRSNTEWIPDSVLWLWWHYRSPMGWTSWLERSSVCQHGLPACGLQCDVWLQRSLRETKVTQHSPQHQTASCYTEKNLLVLQIYYKRVLCPMFLQIFFLVSSWQFCGFRRNIFWANGPLVAKRDELLLLYPGS